MPRQLYPRATEHVWTLCTKEHVTRQESNYASSDVQPAACVYIVYETPPPFLAHSVCNVKAKDVDSKPEEPYIHSVKRSDFTV